jgi:S-adenosylmethionine synthetase|tara:strand:- start:1261 stop:2220 length:960 start_codon:yes stop_codon:yes gene_type:complete
MIRTAECVSPKHPDKMCDRISDTLLDLYLQQDPNSRCAIETCGGNGKVFVTGEVTSTADITEDDIKTVVHNISGVEDVIVHLNSQSPEIAQGVDTGGAGDQGIMIGYACRDNEQFLPQEYYLSRELNRFVFDKFPYDGKTQVTMNGNSLRVVCSFQNAPTEDLIGLVMKFFQEFPQYHIEELHCNPAGDWNIGGFTADAGVTGRKLAVDNYGPRVPLGGGAFSGKDCTKVDRSAAYMARRIAVDILEERPEVQEVFVQLAYAIGYNEPLQASAIVDGEHEFIKGYDLSPKGIIDFLELKKPIFGETAAFGHMGAGFSWK